MKHLHLPALIALFAITASGPAHAQRLKNAPAMTWEHRIEVRPTTIAYGDSSIEAYGFEVYEIDAKELLAMWRSDHAGRSTSIIKGDPMVAKGVRADGLGTEPLTVLARTVQTDRKKAPMLAIAFVADSGKALPDRAAMENHVHDLAVRYNRAVVEAQIAEQEKTMTKATGKMDKSVAEKEKLTRSIEKIKGELNTLKATRMKEQARYAELQGDVVGAEQKFALTNDPKDLKKLTKARDKLGARGTKVTKLMEKEAKLQEQLNKYASELTRQEKEAKERTADKDQQDRTLEALRRKLASIE